MRAAFTALFIVLAITGDSREAEACLCDDGSARPTSQLIKELSDELDRAVAVFSGTVVSATRYSVTFDVDRAWKGITSRTVTMPMGPDPQDPTETRSSCDYTLRLGERHLVFGYGYSVERMRACSCTFTAPFEHAKRTLELLETIAREHTPDEIGAAAQRDRSNNVAPGLSKEGVCMAEGAALVATAPVRVGKSGPTVKPLRGDPPHMADLPRGSRVRLGPWMGEILIGTDGGIVQVWPLREIQIDPPLPSYNETIRTAVRRWSYTTPTLNGTPTPACMTVTVTVDWQ